jgi:hypothetical protein
MPSVTRNPSANASIVAGWSNLANAYASNNSYATASALTAIGSLHGFGFTIPTGATIDGIEISVEGQGNQTQGAPAQP